MKKRILLSARDPGAAFNILTLYRILRKSGLFDIYIAASRPAYEIISSNGIKVYPFIFKDRDNDVFFEDDPKDTLEKKAFKLLDLFKPDLAIVGLSSYGAGIDEAIIGSGAVKTALFQDFWGDLNTVFPRMPDIVFTLDEFGSALTKKRFGEVECRVVGHPKMVYLKELNLDGIVKEVRGKFASGGKGIISFFDQPPFIPGREKILSKIVDSIQGSSMLKDIVFLYRAHPKYREEGQDLIGQMKRCGITAFDVSSHIDPIPFLASSDSVFTLFSSCTTDHALLNAVSDCPRGTAFNFMNKEGSEYYRSVSGLDDLPLISMGTGKLVNTDSDCLDNLIEMALDEDYKYRYWRSCVDKMTDFSIESFIDIVNENI